MRKIFQFLVVSLALAACNSSPYSYYTNGAQCDESYSPNPVVVPPDTTAKYEDITGSLNDPTKFPPGTYKFASMGAYFQDKASDLHIYIAQSLDTSNTTQTTTTTGIPCVRNYYNVGRVPKGNMQSDLTSVYDLTVDSNQNITGHTNTLGYKIAGGGINPVPGPTQPADMTGTIEDVYSAQGMIPYRVYKVTDVDGNGSPVIYYQIRAEKKNDAQGFTLRQIRVSLTWVAPDAANPAPSPAPSPTPTP